MKPNYDEGRFFVSPIVGCDGFCGYWYLIVKGYQQPRKNQYTIESILNIARQTPEFVWGSKGTVISVGAWGDLFPQNNQDLQRHSIEFIKEMLSWGNPVQIMSKNVLDMEQVKTIAEAVQYSGQLLYSTTITSLKEWQHIEPGTSSPLERLETCKNFQNYNIPTNVLLKPFIPDITGNEIEQITNVLLEYGVDYSVLGILYLSEEIENQIKKNPILNNAVLHVSSAANNHLDCYNKYKMKSTEVDSLLPYLQYMREHGVNAFLKSSCVNANILSLNDPSDYYRQNSQFCIHCGNCKKGD